MKPQISLLLAASLVLTPLALAQQRSGAAGANRGGAGAGAVPRGGAGAARANPAQPGNSPASQAANQQPANPASDGQSSDNAQNSNMWSVADHILNSDSLAVDSENGIFQWNNSKFSIGDNMVVRQRFERYLSSPGFDNTADYQIILQQIQNLLTTNTAATTPDANSTAPASGDKIYQAWQLLYAAAKYPQDGGASETLANQVFNSWRVRDELAGNRDQYSAQEELRQRQESSIADVGESRKTDSVDFARQNPGLTGAYPEPGKNVGVITPKDFIGDTTLGNMTNSSGGSSGNGSGGATGGGPVANLTISNVTLGDAGSVAAVATPQLKTTSVMAQKATELARTYAKMALLDADATQMGLKAKAEYQTQLVTFMGQRRFQHSLLAGMFYEHIFQGSQQRVTVAKEEISKFINTDSIVPSVNSFEFVSHEAIAEVDSGMRAVEAAYDRGDRWIALQQLQTTFLLGENLPPVQNFDPAKRHVLLGIYTASTALKHMMEVHDFASAEDRVNKISVDAKDFADSDAGPILSAIKVGEQTSNNLVLAARQAALSGDADRVTENLQKATEIWPLNPEIANFSKTMLDRTNLSNVGASKFDDLYARGDDRAIYDSKEEIGLALYQDPVRSAKFKEIVNREARVEVAIDMANQAMKQNNGYAAYELLAGAAELEPNDPVLNRTQTQVVSRVAPFVSALDQAQRAEKAGELGASLNYYLQAQDIYPPSQICHDAIESLSLKIMAKLNPNGTSAKELVKQDTGTAAQ